MLLVLAAGATGLIMEGSLVSRAARFIVFLIGSYSTRGCADAFNQHFERHIDSRMTHTRHRRLLARGHSTAAKAAVGARTAARGRLNFLDFRPKQFY
ncbi:MAG: hypothetical protein JSV44_10330 [Candidatus Zixiibacteriota bacterium]|nr:MAG: hypothetical protein JSV44_10330 [candidate division Zixibacteria bacterium]